MCDYIIVVVILLEAMGAVAAAVLASVVAADAGFAIAAAAVDISALVGAVIVDSSRHLSKLGTRHDWQ